MYFTFNQLLNSIRYSNLYKIEGYSTKDLIRLMDYAIDCTVEMLENCEKNDLVFASRYEKSGGGSDDDTFVTLTGNKIFSFLSFFLLF